MTRYIIDQQTHDEIAARHAQFWRSHRAEPLGCCKKCKHFEAADGRCETCIGNPYYSNNYEKGGKE